jgi:uncharacterized protein YegP (UPF0339 family)
MSTRSLFGGLLGLAVAALFAGSEAKAVADKLTFELYKDNAGEFRWRLKDGDSTMATSGQGYKAKADAKNGIDRIMKDAAGDKLTFEVYEDAKKEYRWKVLAKNGNNIGSSSGGYKAKSEAEAAVKKVKDGAAKAEVTDLTKK